MARSRKKPEKTFEVPDAVANASQSGWVHKSSDEPKAALKKTRPKGSKFPAKDATAVTVIPAGHPRERRKTTALDLLWWPFAAVVTHVLALGPLLSSSKSKPGSSDSD